jgi:hypothetical protein
MHGFDVPKVFKRRKMMRVLPNNIWQANQEGNRRGDPKPFRSEEFPLRRDLTSTSKMYTMI